ncbi:MULTISPECIES: hypothetical protein [unclassified Streptomyces]|uniref:hypothetical protein n=1 Tax=unclassified Streptomyces TaxID=2593676 RepID=UPI0038126E51
MCCRELCQTGANCGHRSASDSQNSASIEDFGGWGWAVRSSAEASLAHSSTAVPAASPVDRRTPADWHQAATRALAALGGHWANAGAPGPSRLLLVACLRLARDHHLTDLGWLNDAAHAYTDGSVWEPLALPAASAEPVPDTPVIARPPARTPRAHRGPPHCRSSTPACCPPNSPRNCPHVIWPGP